MIFWILVGLMTILALAFVLLPIFKPEIGRKPLLIAGLVLGLPLIAVLAYEKLGSPAAVKQSPAELPGVPTGAMPSDHPSAKVMNMDLSQLADKLAVKLKASPDNPDGWALLARTYVEVKRYKDALPAFEKASAMLPKDPHLLADYADALAMSNGGFDAKSEALVDQALALDPSHVKALMLKATISFNRKDYPKAIAAWEKILTVPGLDAERTKEARGSIEEARRVMSAGK
jgi:cytochrome c-type biogenesis protein CcmH